MSFGDHLEDLRRRVIMAGLGFIPIFVLALLFGRPILAFLTIPLTEALRDAGQPAGLLATSPLETFGAYMRVSVIVGVMVAFPWMLYQLWLFVAPGLYTHERRFVYFLVPLSTALTAAAAVFLYKFLLPVSLYFLIAFGSTIVQEDHGTLPPDDVPALG
ncbi:MAG: twin-arginine translocase subunit TatC, partial [Phycisphaerales bacterium]|nr:twin-arginine translocase subunit TatC [Phycisphaerales bacterium]